MMSIISSVGSNVGGYFKEAAAFWHDLADNGRYDDSVTKDDLSAGEAAGTIAAAGALSAASATIVYAPIYALAALALAACAPTSSDKSCPSREIPAPFTEFSPPSYDATDPDRGPVTYTVSGIIDADNTLEALTVTAFYGEEAIDVALETSADLHSFYNAPTITATVVFLYPPGPNTIKLKIQGKCGQERVVDLDRPLYLPPETMADTCDPRYNTWTGPHFTGNSEGQEVAPLTITRVSRGYLPADPAQDIGYFKGDVVEVTFPGSDIAQCDNETTGADLGNTIAARGSVGLGGGGGGSSHLVTNNSNNYLMTYTLTDAGEHNFAMAFWDSNPEHDLDAADRKYARAKIDFVQDPELLNRCESNIPYPTVTNSESSRPSRLPHFNGDDTVWTLTVQAQDGCGEAVEVINSNLNLFFDNPVIENRAEGGNHYIVISGPRRPNAADRGAMQMTIKDRQDNTLVFNVGGLPALAPVSFSTAENFWQQDEALTFETSQVLGARSYRYWAETADGSIISGTEQTKTPASNPTDYHLYEYIPGQTGNQTVRLEITAYNGEIIEAAASALVHEAAVAACSVAIPSFAPRVPSTASLHQGDPRIFTWHLEPGRLVDSCGQPLHFSRHNLSQLAASATRFDYNEESGELTVTGQLSPLANGLPMSVTFTDATGAEYMIELYVPTIDPLIVVPENVDAGELSRLYLNYMPPGPARGANIVWTVDGRVAGTEAEALHTFAQPTTSPGLARVAVTFEAWSGDYITIERNVTVWPSAARCAEIPYFGEFRPIPSRSELPSMVEGGQYELGWERGSGLVDCHGNNLILLGDNLNDVLHATAPDGPYRSGPAGDTGFSIFGIPRSINGEDTNIRLRWGDADGHNRFSVLPLPPLDPLQLQKNTYEPRAGEAFIISLLREAPGAREYRYTVTRPDGINEPASQLTDEFEYTPSQPGSHTVKLEVLTFDNEIKITYLYFYAMPAADAGVCYSIPGPDFLTPSPNAPLPQGSNQPIRWSQRYTDCNGGLLTLLEPVDAYEFLDTPEVIYNSLTRSLEVGGPVNPHKTGGAMILTLQDSNLNEKRVTLGLPTIWPFEITTPANFIQAGNPVRFYHSRGGIPGSRNQNYYVEQADGTSIGPFNDSGENFDFTLANPQAGLNTLRVNATVYNGELISARYPFNATAAADDACYSIWAHGQILDPRATHPRIVRGEVVDLGPWTVFDLNDCHFNNLTLLPDHNINEVLYGNPSVLIDYTSGTFTVDGFNVRTTVADGTIMNPNFIDNWGHLYADLRLRLPPIVTPEMVITYPENPFHITTRDNLTVRLLTSPEGATFNLTMIRPDGSVYTAGPLVGLSEFIIPASQKNLPGVYDLTITVTGGDGGSYPVYKSAQVIRTDE